MLVQFISYIFNFTWLDAEYQATSGQLDQFMDQKHTEAAYLEFKDFAGGELWAALHCSFNME